MLPGAAQDSLDPISVIDTAISVLFYSIGETNDLIATKGELPYDNRFTIFASSADDVVLNTRVERINGDRRARNYARTGLSKDRRIAAAASDPPQHARSNHAVPARAELHRSQCKDWPVLGSCRSKVTPLQLLHRTNFSCLHTSSAADGGGNKSLKVNVEP